MFVVRHATLPLRNDWLTLMGYGVCKTVVTVLTVEDNGDVKQRTFPSSIRFLAMAGLFSLCCSALAQTPTAIRRLQPSAFALVNETFTGLEANQTTSLRGGRNTAFTLGGDMGIYSPGRYSLAVEVRGTYPISSGNIVSEKSILGGVRFSREPSQEGGLSHLRPYVDVLFGRGQLDYQNGGYVTPNLLFYQSNTNILDGGGGLEVDLTQHFSLKVDVQAQRWKTPVLPGGTMYSKQGGVGVTYRFGVGSGPR
jgi:hypothetical protein